MVGVNQPRTKKWINRPYLLPRSLSCSSQSRFPMGENFRARNLGVKQSWHSHLSLMVHKKISIWCCLNRLQVSHDDLPHWEIPQHWGTLQLWPAELFADQVYWDHSRLFQAKCSSTTVSSIQISILGYTGKVRHTVKYIDSVCGCCDSCSKNLYPVVQDTPTSTSFCLNDFTWEFKNPISYKNT